MLVVVRTTSEPLLIAAISTHNETLPQEADRRQMLFRDIS
jgi:hypothetical protein